MNKKKFSRRQCIKFLAATGLTLSSPYIFTPLAQASTTNKNICSKTLPLMGTLVNISLLDSSNSKAREVVENGFAYMKRLISIFDRFDPNSHVSWLNQKGYLNDVPPELFTVLSSAGKLNRLSRQTFDITILPLLELQSQSFKQTGHPPCLSEVKDRLALVGQEKIKISPKKISFSQTGQEITLDGIAKGFIVQQTAAFIQAKGISSGLINAGGDIATIGTNKGRSWVIGIQDPTRQQKQVQTVRLQGQAIATSGSYENYFDRWGRHSHLLSSATGESPTRNVSCSVIAPNAMLADGLATTLFLMSPQKALALVSQLPKVECLLLTQGNRQFVSAGWKNFTS